MPRFVPTQPYSSQKAAPSPGRKKHICSTCDRPFTTSGHLSRHSRVHTGERNHRCPFPGCDTRCSRQDNLQQHYRIHLSPGSRRNSVRTNTPRKRASASRTPESTTPQHPGTPPIDQARIILYPPSLSDSTPPLAQATLPSSTTLPPISGRFSATPSPSTSYSPDPQHVLPALPSLELSPPPGSNYRTGTVGYHDQSPANTYTTFVNNASQNGSHNAVGGSSFTYSHSHSNFASHSQQNGRTPAQSAAMHSRHSLSHSGYLSSHGPPSPTSVSSHTSTHSEPPTPSYPVSYADNHTYSHPHSTMVTSAAHNNQMQSPSYPFQNAYTPNSVIAHSPRYLPPLTLAPIQDERYIRRQETPRHSQSYLHQPLAGYSQYHSMGVGHAWKTDIMRKGLGAAVI